MKATMLMIVGLFVLFGAPLASAQEIGPPCPPGQTLPKDDVLICWTNATQNKDGTQIPAEGDAALKSTVIQQRFVGSAAECSFGTVDQTYTVLPGVTRLFFDNVQQYGRLCFRVKHVNNKDISSAWTEAVSKVTVKPAPPPPPKPKVPSVTIY